jgi:hypothetical protein
MINYKYKYLKYKLKYNKIIKGGASSNNQKYKIALVGCWNCSLDRCDKGKNTVNILKNINLIKQYF